MKKLSLLLALLMILMCGCDLKKSPAQETSATETTATITTEVSNSIGKIAPHDHYYKAHMVIREATCSDYGETLYICTVCESIKISYIPATNTHTFVNDVCKVCGKVSEDAKIPEAPKPEQVTEGILSYNFLYDTPGFAGGTIEFKPKTTATYTFYWGNANGKLADHTMLYSEKFTANVSKNVSIQSFTSIPKGATKLLAIGSDGTNYSYDIPTTRLLNVAELYSFGAISDTHQGDRYDSTGSIPYSHFINASKILHEKGAVAIGICGDFSYDNEEWEYILHADAIRDIFEIAPDMPIFTTSGNHEAKYTGFSKDWYLQYTRNLVNYNSNLTMKFFDGNDLDYVVELPDGSVMIYLHQKYYDYGKSYSRLLDDSQLDWLGQRFEQYKDRAVFLYFHTFMDESVGDATSSGGGEYSLPLISSTKDYKRLDEYFKKYTNVIYFSGHSHLSFDSQFVKPKTGKTNYNKNIDDKNGTYATMVHIPSCAAPRVLSSTSSSLTDAKNRSEGYLVHVYEEYIVFEGYDFVNNQTIAYATYIIEK